MVSKLKEGGRAQQVVKQLPGFEIAYLHLFPESWNENDISMDFKELGIDAEDIAIHRVSRVATIRFVNLEEKNKFLESMGRIWCFAA